MADFNNPLEAYWSLVHRRAAQDMKKFSFGSEMEAASGGSSATFRASDSPEYVSKIFSDSPVSFIKRYPEQIAQMRRELGLDEQKITDIKPTNPTTPTPTPYPPLVNDDSALGQGNNFGFDTTGGFGAWFSQNQSQSY